MARSHSRKGKKKKDDDGLLETYRKIRKPKPPPSRVIPDKRRKIEDRTAEEEMEEDEKLKNREAEQVRVHVFVKGRVQGVCFRTYTQEQAEGLSLTGWVRNLRDGRVEVLAEGVKKDIDKLLDWLHIGPPGSHVTKLDHLNEDHTGEYDSFRIVF